MKRFRTLSVCLSLAVAGCAGTNVTPMSSVANPASQAGASGSGRTVQASGSFRPSGAIRRDAPALRVKHDKASYKRALYVADSGGIKIFTNTYYRELGTITNGVANPSGLAMDQLGNLYVANAGAADVTEYGPGETSPSFTYNASASPNAVAVDRHGNVFEVDYYGVNEYFQKTNYANHSCNAKPYSYYYPLGVTVDADGDVFVLYYGFYGTGVFEYKGGLAGCNATHVLRDTYAWDMILDSNKDLIISRTVFYSGGSFGEVDVFDPPYAYGGTIGSGFSSPTGISLNKKNKLLFVADSYSGEVTVVNYQTGQNIKELGAAYGISDPRAVVDGPNAVY